MLQGEQVIDINLYFHTLKYLLFYINIYIFYTCIFLHMYFFTHLN